MYRITKEDIEEFRLRINKWVATGKDLEDKEMLKMYAEDRKELKHILDLIKNGSYKRASQRIYALDTMVRDEIPKQVYDTVMMYYA